MTRPLRLLVVAGEVSGDQHAAALLDALRARAGEVEAIGVGGDRCRARGVRLVAHQKELAVIGLVEAISRIRFARRLIGDLAAAASREGVDGAVLTDSPDFNLPLARRLASAGIPVVFYVSPQVWAWRSGRAADLIRLGRRVLVLFRFEKRWYDARGLGANVEWVGHPLVDEAEEELARPHAPPEPGKRRVVLMPGSRDGEVRRLLPLLREAVARLSTAHRGLDVVLVRSPSISEEVFRDAAGPDLDRWTVVSGPHLSLLAASDLLLVASGTATVEGVLAGTPMVVVYRVHPITYALGRFLVKVDHVAMANIVSDDGTGVRAVPELIQGDATPEHVAAEAARFLEDPARAAEARRRLALGREALGPPGAAGRAARALLSALGRAEDGGVS